MTVCLITSIKSNVLLREKCQRLLLVASLALTIVTWFILFGHLDDLINVSPDDDNLRGSIFQGAATIAGLAIFGSAITVRIHHEQRVNRVQKLLQFYAYGGITLLVLMQGVVMIQACCMDIDSPLLMAWILTTTILLLWTGSFLTILAVSRGSVGERAYHSLRVELENIYQTVSENRTVVTRGETTVRYAHKYISHDIYDSLLTTGHILHVDLTVQQLAQNIIRMCKSHNEYFKRVVLLNAEGGGAGNAEAPDHMFAYLLEMPPLEDNILNMISELLGENN